MSATTDEGWESVATLGEKIDWKDDPVFVGVFNGETQHVMEDGSLAKAFMLADEQGHEYFTWRSQQLGPALDRVAIGTTVRITHLGKSEMNNGQAVNKYKVEQRRAAKVPTADDPEPF